MLAAMKSPVTTVAAERTVSSAPASSVKLTVRRSSRLTWSAPGVKVARVAPAMGVNPAAPPPTPVLTACSHW
ncbi:hypothetical protein D3C72_1009370 [compost metagenome]